MRTLPYDYHRCEPEAPDSNCQKCLRWANLPSQTWGERTATVLGRQNSADHDCSYIAIEEQK